MQDYDVYNRPDEERVFTSVEIARMCGVHKARVHQVAEELKVLYHKQGQIKLFPYISMRQIADRISHSKVRKVKKSPLVTDERCYLESWFPDPTPECLKEY